MRRYIFALAGAAASFAGPVAADPASDNAAAIAEAERLGREVYAHDRAAWVSTDLLVEMRGDQLAEEIGGWVEETVDGGVRVLYFDRAGGRPVYAVLVKDGKASSKDVVRYPADGAFTPEERRLVDARNLAAKQEFQACSRAYNTVTIDAEGGHYVYLLAATEKAGEVPFGGHYRFRVNEGGTAVEEFRKFTKSCITLGADLPKGAVLSALMISQVLTPHPTEIHAWKSLETGLDVFVVTVENNALWKVSGGRITYEDEIGRKKSAAFDVSREGLGEADLECADRLRMGGDEAACGASASAFPPRLGLRETSVARIER